MASLGKPCTQRRHNSIEKYPEGYNALTTLATREFSTSDKSAIMLLRSEH